MRTTPASSIAASAGPDPTGERVAERERDREGDDAQRHEEAVDRDDVAVGEQVGGVPLGHGVGRGEEPAGVRMEEAAHTTVAARDVDRTGE